MGLDMYLSAERHYLDKEWVKDDEARAIHGKVLNAIQADNFICKDNLGTINVEVEVAYWRKANAIHAWFIRECSGGVDDCRPVYVPREKLTQLLGLCYQVKSAPELAPELLPSQEGFFFGSTEYDEWYFNDIDDTIQQLSNVLENTPDGWRFTYTASW